MLFNYFEMTLNSKYRAKNKKEPRPKDIET